MELYTNYGVDTQKEESALSHLLKWVGRTEKYRKGMGEVRLESGYFANVLDIGHNMGLAISTDGVGTKLLVAQLMDKYDTIGIDCIAMNVNDILCVGAEPISMVDYIAVQEPNARLFEEIGKGLDEGARIARINIPGGEVAQIKEMIKGVKEGYGFDIAGAAVGLVGLDKIIIGAKLKEGDVVLGLRSSGIHSNGLTLARNVLFDKNGLKVDRYFKELGRTLGEELLEPTHIYVPEIIEVLNAGIGVKSLAHITSDGLLNLLRVEKKDISFVIDYLPEPQPIFSMLQKLGNINDEEMFQVFNMGIGFCIVVETKDAERCEKIFNKHSVQSYRLGYTVKSKEQEVFLKPKNLVGRGNRFYKG